MLSRRNLSTSSEWTGKTQKASVGGSEYKKAVRFRSHKAPWAILRILIFVLEQWEAFKLLEDNKNDLWTNIFPAKEKKNTQILLLRYMIFVFPCVARNIMVYGAWHCYIWILIWSLARWMIWERFPRISEPHFSYSSHYQFTFIWLNQ